MVATAQHAQIMSLSQINHALRWSQSRLLNSETWLTNTTIMPVDASRLRFSPRNQRKPLAEHNFGVTLFSVDNDDRADEHSAECDIEHRAPESSGVSIKRSSSRWQQRTTDFSIVTKIFLMKFCARVPLCLTSGCVFVQYPKQLRH